MNVYDLGTIVRSKSNMKNLAGAEVNPGTVTVKVKSPLGVITTYVYLTNPEVVKDSDGNYHIDIDPDRQGVWSVEWKGTGANKGAKQSAFQIAESQFD